VEKAPTELHISPTVQGVLAARIDRLALDEKALLQQLAVIGRQFPLSLVRQVVAQPEEALYHLLSSLQRKEFLYEQLALPEPDYIFKHALTQEVAYGTVLQDKRKALHERTAQAIESLYGTKLEDHYSELAYHYSRSGNTQKAVEYLGLAGQQAVRHSANAEAISHLTSALDLLKTLPDTPERAQQELALQIALGVPLMITKGYASPEVAKVYTRARELCRQGGETSQLFSVLMGLWLSSTTRAECQAARELGEQLFSLAQRTQDPALLVEAHYALGTALFYLGEVAPALAHFEQGIALYDPPKHRSYTFLCVGIDPKAICLSWASVALWFLGYPDQALKRSSEALTLARELSHPYSLAWALDVAAWVHQLRREGHLTQEQVEAELALCHEHGFTFYLVSGTIRRGWTLVEQGQGEEGIAQMRQGMASWRAIGAETERPGFLTLLATAYGEMGQPEEGLTVLAEALAALSSSGERRWEAELYRLKGMLTLQKFKVQGSKFNGEEEAETCFHKAIEIARKQQAKSLELRASTSLARLWQQQGKQKEAHAMLAEIYGWFTEGFDTKDLQEAKALLVELK